MKRIFMLIAAATLMFGITVTAYADAGVITAIDAPEKTEYSFEFKCSLEDVTREFPETLTVHAAGKTISIDAGWVCTKDYNDKLGRYEFVPDMGGFTLSEDVKLPVITVIFDKEEADAPKGLNPFPGPQQEVSMVSGSDGRLLMASGLPSKYNLKEERKLPPLRNQNPYGTCWAHAAIGAMETDLITDGKASTDVDLSEMHLAYYFYHRYEDPKHCRSDEVTQVSGGADAFLNNGSMPLYAVYQMSNLVGAVKEDDVPYSVDLNTFDPDMSFVVSKDAAQIRNAYFINNKDLNAIKNAVMEHGGAALAYCDEDMYYNSTNAAYYCSDENKEVNHGVMIVGWDDGFSRTNFNTAPEGDGAWLIRNSWGGYDDRYSHEGYFWLSYYDRSVAQSPEPAVAVDADTGIYKHCYAYDGFPFPCALEYIGPNDELTVTYDVSAHEAVKGVGIILNSVNVTVNATARNERTGQCVSGQIKTTSEGMYTVVFNEPLEVYEDSTVSVLLKARSDDDADVAVGTEIELPQPLLYGVFTLNPVVDRGYYLNGEKKSGADIRVKLYTDDSSATYTKVTGVSLAPDLTVKKGATTTLTATVIPSDATFKTVSWSSSNNIVATVSADGVVTGIGPGTSVITVKTTDGGKTATCIVTVPPVSVEEVRLNKTEATVYAGKTLQLTATVSPSDAANGSLKWKSSNRKIATVTQKGKVKAVKAGKATITVTALDGSKKKATCKITVKDIKVKSVKLKKTKVSVKKGKTIKLKATVKPSNATNKAVSWKSSNKKIATVSKNGKVKGIKKGIVTITATATDGSKKKAKCKITVK